MNVLSESFFEYSVSVLSSVDVIKISAVIIIVSLIASSFSVCLTTTVYGYPKPSLGLLILYFTESLFCYLLALSDYAVKGKTFSRSSYAFIYFIAMIVAITGLYAVFLKIAESVCDNFKPAKELTFTYVNKIADVIEEEDKSYGVSRVLTEKSGVKKQRYDDGINYYKLFKFVDELNGVNLSPVESATLNVCESVIKRYKNTMITDLSRRELNEAFLTIVKIYAENHTR